MDKNSRQQVVEHLQTANNVLVTLSRNPSVDQLAACIGLTLLLNKLGKHATAVFSGQAPSTIEFLQPEKTLEKNTDSLRDFIISLDKAKADKLRYKVEDEVVKIFITPYKTSISQRDLEFGQGDFNVDVVIALGVHQKEELDQAIITHGRILHDAVVVSVNNQNNANLGTINWIDTAASSLCEMMAAVSQDLNKNILDTQIATAFLTGIVAETNRFSNQKVNPNTMSLAGMLMAAGASSQLVATKLEAVPSPNKSAPSSHQTSKNADSDGELHIVHDQPTVAPIPKPTPPVTPIFTEKTTEEEPENDALQYGLHDDNPVPEEIHIDEQGQLRRLDSKTPAPPTPEPKQPEPEPISIPTPQPTLVDPVLEQTVPESTPEPTPPVESSSYELQEPTPPLTPITQEEEEPEPVAPTPEPQPSPISPIASLPTLSQASPTNSQHPTQDEEEPDLFSLPPVSSPTPLLKHNSSSTLANQPEPQQPLDSQKEPIAPQLPEEPTIHDEQTLTDIEQAVHSSHLDAPDPSTVDEEAISLDSGEEQPIVELESSPEESDTSQPTSEDRKIEEQVVADSQIDSARAAVSEALNAASQEGVSAEPIVALGAQPLGGELHLDPLTTPAKADLSDSYLPENLVPPITSSHDTDSKSGDIPSPPPGPPPMMPPPLYPTT